MENTWRRGVAAPGATLVKDGRELLDPPGRPYGHPFLSRMGVIGLVGRLALLPRQLTVRYQMAFPDLYGSANSPTMDG
jgi:hypothetical protein